MENGKIPWENTILCYSETQKLHYMLLVGRLDYTLLVVFIVQPKAHHYWFSEYTVTHLLEPHRNWVCEQIL